MNDEYFESNCNICAAPLDQGCAHNPIVDEINDKLAELIGRVGDLDFQASNIRSEVRNLLHGKVITIDDKYYNGQPHGSSRKSMFGRHWIYYKDKIGTGDVCINNGEIIVCPPFAQAYLNLNKCIVKEQEDKDE